MRYYVFAVRDVASEAYGVPLFMVARGQAIRAFADQVNDPRDGNPLFAHAEDFDLYALGVYDDAVAGFDCFPVPERVAVGKDLKVRGNGNAS